MSEPTKIRRYSANADVLLWQSRVRAAVVLLVGGAELGLVLLRVMPGNAHALLWLIASYALVTGGLALMARYRRTATDWAVAATVLADLVFVFGSTIASSPPEYYDRILIFSFFILHLTESHFGRGHATLALGATVTGYVGLVLVRLQQGELLLWRQELWSVLVFATAAGVFVLQYGSFRSRLGSLVRLFGRAEEGDFSETYNVRADRHPDAITRVGHAYNRVCTQLASMVLTDPLTGCVNRRGLDQALAREVARAARTGSEIAVLALDLDHFKQVNDTYGHPVGDAVLRDTASLILRAARAGDVVARTGGEEFAILMPDTGGSGAFQLATRLCDMVRMRAFVLNGARVPVTVSIGVIATGLVDDDRPVSEVADELLARADEALYGAKRGGRDRVRTWTPSEPHAEYEDLVTGLLARS